MGCGGSVETTKPLNNYPENTPEGQNREGSHRETQPVTMSDPKH